MLDDVIRFDPLELRILERVGKDRQIVHHVDSFPCPSVDVDEPGLGKISAAEIQLGQGLFLEIWSCGGPGQTRCRSSPRSRPPWRAPGYERMHRHPLLKSDSAGRIDRRDRRASVEGILFQ